MESINILVVEDDADINELLCTILKRKGYVVTSAYSGSEAKMCLQMHDYKLVMLDLMLPAVTGEELIEQIRKTKTMPIIVISAKTANETKVQVLKLGADDFVAKPFDVEEVLARVEAQLRRYMVFSNTTAEELVLTYKNLRLERDMHRVFVKEEEIVLTAREYAILELLMSYPNKVFTKANLFEHVWNDAFLGDDNTVNVHISNLRSKIAKADSSNEYIKTVWGIGFKMQDN